MPYCFSMTEWLVSQTDILGSVPVYVVYGSDSKVQLLPLEDHLL